RDLRMDTKSQALKPDVAVATRASELFQLEDVAFAELGGKLLGRGLRDGALAFDTAPISGTYTFRPDNGMLHGVLPFLLTLDVTPEGEAKQPLAELRVVPVLRYRVRAAARPPTEEEAAHYAGVLGFLHAWPYVRAEVQSI